MPDLDRLLDTLVTDVTAGTRAPGASAAIQQAHRRRVKVVAAAAAAAVAFIAVGGGLAAGTLGHGDRISPVEEPTLPSPEPTPGSDEHFEVELRKILTQVPDWAVTDADPTILHPCGGDWSERATGASGGSFGIRTPDEGPSVWHDAVGFPSADKASDAVALLVENLESCTAVVWRTQPIGQTPAVLASSADGVIWIQQNGDLVSTLQVPTTDGPPPASVQIEVAKQMADDMVHKQKD